MKRKICFLLVILVFLMACKVRYDWSAMTIDNEANLAPNEFKNSVYEQAQEMEAPFTQICFIWRKIFASGESEHYLEVCTLESFPEATWHNLPEKREGFQIEWADIFF